MSKRKTPRRAGRSRSTEEGTVFSLVAMHNEMRKVIKRLKEVPGPKAAALRKQVDGFLAATDCGQTMAPRL